MMMKRCTHLLLSLLLLILLAACNQDNLDGTPTPFFQSGVETEFIASNAPETAVISELLAEPETFANTYLQLNGRYQSQPKLICSGDAFRSPATWALTDEDGTAVLIGGFDALRDLFATGDDITINGFWQQWQGPVGCGKDAVPQEIWYLKATELVSPSQIAGSSNPPGDTESTSPLTPVSTEGSAETTPETTPDATPSLDAPPAEEEATPETAVTPTPATPSSVLPSTTPNPDGYPGDPSDEKITPVAGDELATPTSGTPAPTNNAATPPPGGTTQPGATPTTMGAANEYDELQVDSINPDDGSFGLDTLDEWQKHLWPLSVTTSQAVTISVAAEPVIDTVLAIRKESGEQILSQNEQSYGELETINNFRLEPQTNYLIEVYSASGVGGDYILTVWGDDSEIVLNSRGILQSGTQESDTIAADHRHFWYFYATQGQTAVLDVPTSNGRVMLITLLDDNGDLVENDDGPVEYIEESLEATQLPATGLYIIWLEEVTYDPANYTITLTLTP